MITAVVKKHRNHEDRKHEDRKHERVPAPVVGLVDVFINVSKGNSSFKVRLGPSLLEDVSAGGASIQIDNFVDVGKILYLSNRYVRFAAQVRHCRASGAGFRLGLEFLPTTW